MILNPWVIGGRLMLVVGIVLATHWYIRCLLALLLAESFLFRLLHKEKPEQPQPTFKPLPNEEEIRLARDFIKMQENKAQEKLSQFYGQMIHKLKSPLTLVYGFSNLLSDKGQEMSELNRQRYSDLIFESCEDLLKLVDQDLIRIKNNVNGWYTECQEEKLHETLSKVMEGFRLRYPDNKTNLRENQPQINAWVDPSALEIIVHHLLENAVLHGRENSVVDVHVSNDIETVTISVTNLVDEEMVVEDIFEPFSSTNGTGLGLYIVSQFTRSMGGVVSLDRSVGGEVSFNIQLRRRPPQVMTNPITFVS